MKKLLVLISAFFLFSCGENNIEPVDETAATNENTIIATLSKNIQFNSFVSFIKDSKLEEILNSSEPITIFAPTNEAMKILLDNDPALEIIMPDKLLLEKIIKTHITSGRLTMNDLLEKKDLLMLSGEVFALTKGAKITLGNYELGETILVPNGIVHTIHGMMIPDDMQILIEGPLEPEPIIPVEPTIDIEEPKEDIHTPLPTAFKKNDKSRENTPLLQILEEDGRFQTFTGLLKKFKFDEKLNTDENYTIFAPTDEAFRPLFADEESIDLMFKDPYLIPTLLATHITYDKLTLEGIANLIGIETIAGIELSVDQDENAIFVIGGNSRIIEANILAKNGVIHILDLPIFPELIEEGEE